MTLSDVLTPRGFSRLCGALTVLIGLVTLAGWLFGIEALKNPPPGLMAMKANTALCFALSGGALLLFDDGNPVRRQAARVLAWLVLAIALVTLGQHVFGWNAHIDELLASDPSGAGAGAPGRMLPGAAIGLALFSIALLLLARPGEREAGAAQFLAAVIMLFALMILLGFGYGAAGPQKVSIFRSRAVYGMVCAALLGAGLLAARADAGWIAEFARDTPSARMGRRMIGAVLVLLPILGWLRLQGERAGLYSEEVGVSITAVGGVALLAWFVLWATRAANRVEDTNRKYAERLAILHEIDSGLIANDTPEAIAEAALRPLRDLLDVPRAIVNLFDFEKGEAEWLVAIGRQRMHVGPGVRYPLSLLGDLEALRRGELQIMNTAALPASPHKDALLESGVEVYMVVPMRAAGQLIGALSFGGAARGFRVEQIAIAKEAATQLAIAVTQARLHAQVRHQAEVLEHRVQERTAELERANKELASFSYTVSHDLRTPLRAMDGFARIFEDDYGDRVDAEGRRLLGVIRDSSRRMGQLIDDLLAFSMLGRQAMHPMPLDMNALAAEAWAELGTGSTTTCIIASLPAARGDRSLIKQVWANLLSNALKYSAKQQAPFINVTGKLEDDEVVYCVSDNGVGFDMRHYGKLFGVFQRLHAASEFSGTGVGLATVHRIITRHGGRVWAESAIGAGARFYFSLPLEDVA